VSHVTWTLVVVVTILGISPLGLLPAPAEAQSTMWARQFGTASGDFALGVAARPVSGKTGCPPKSGGVYVVGTTAGQLPGQVSAGGMDAFIRLYDEDGNLCWTRQFGTPGTDMALAVATDPKSDHVYVVGFTGGALGGPSAGGNDAFVRKYNGAGSLLWTRQFGTDQHDEFAGVVVRSKNGDVAVAGSTLVVPEEGDPHGDVIVRLITSDGAQTLWSRQFGTPAYELGLAVVTVEPGLVFVAGVTAGALPDGGGSAGGIDGFVRGYNTDDGSVAWTRQFGTSADDQVWGLGTDGFAAVYVVGDTSGTLPGEVNVGGVDAYAQKYSRKGDLLWTRQFGTAGVDQAFAVTFKSGVFVVGITDGAFPGYSSAGGFDGFVRKYKADGGEQWTYQFGSAEYDEATAVAPGRSGRVFVGGSTLGTLPGQVSSGGFDAFVLLGSPKGSDDNGEE